MALAFVGCAPSQSEPAPEGEDVIQVSGTVEFISLEGGFYAIRTADGKTYDPINLPQEYHHQGMRVRVKARMRGDVASVHMAGPIIEILSIEKR
jgi:hypothetical protein